MINENYNKSKIDQFRKFLPFILKSPITFIVGLVSLVLLVLFNRLIPQLLGEIVDKVFVNKDYSFLKKAIYMYAFLEISILVFNFTKSYFFQIFAHRMLFYLREKMIDHVHHLPLSYFNKNSSGRITHRLTQDMLNLVNFYSDTGITILTHTFAIVSVILAMFLISVKMSLIILLILPFYLILGFKLTGRIQNSQRDLKQKLSVINGYLAEKTMGIKVIQLYNRIQFVKREFLKLSEDYRKASIHQAYLSALLQPVFNFMSGTNVTLAMALGSWFVYKNELGAGSCIAFILHVQDMIYPLRDSIEKYQEIQNSMTSGERILSLLDESPEISNEKSQIKTQNKWQNEKNLNQFGIHQNEVYSMKGDIEIKDLDFRYNENENWILKSVNLKVPGGVSIALIGRTGSGKTTLASLLQRLYTVPTGRIFIDQMDITQIPIKKLRSQIGLVQQDPFLFRGSILDNVRLFNTSISKEQVDWCLEQVGLQSILKRTGRDVNWVILESGSNLSMGERQLVAFARILAFNPPLVILDEATANLDSETEKLIQEATKKILQGRTSLIIAHRLTTIEHCDYRWKFSGDGQVVQI